MLKVFAIAGKQDKLMFSTANSVKEVDLDTGVVTEVYTHNTTVYMSIAYDVTHIFIYISRFYEDTIIRYRHLVLSDLYLFCDWCYLEI